MGRIVRAGMVFMALAAATTAEGALADFQGRWKSTDSKTKGVTTLEIEIVGDKVTVHAWGSCVPSDCDMGEWSATAYASAVDESVQEGAKALVVGMGKSSTLVITLDRPGTIRCDMYSQYNDGSGRSNMVRSYTFNRSPIQPKRR